MDQDLGDTTAVRPAELCCPLHDPLATPHSLELLSDVSDISLASLNSHLWRSRDLCDVSSDEEDLEDDNASPLIEEDGDALESGLTSSHLDDCVVHLVSLAQRWLIRDTPTTAPLPSTAVSQCLSFLNFDDSPNVVDVAPLSFPAETHILPVLHLALPHHASPENLINLGLAGERGKCSDELSPILFVGLSGLDSDQSSNASNFCAEGAVGSAAAVSPPPVSLSQLLIPSVSSEVPSALGLGFLGACDAQDNHELDLDSHEVVALGLGALELDTPDLGSLDPDASDLYMLDWNSIDLDTLELVSLPIGCSASSIFFAADSPDPSSGSLRLLITEDSTGFVLSASSSFDAQSISRDRLAGEDGDDVEEERARRWEQIRTGAACVALVGSVVLLSAVGFVMV
ncbi:hypothetical protein BC628DRAFT_214179 [Trametes gibbosa]|nr:hypothetical protein BC628DRAFT_214179 [Trametes gibbosa]